MSDRTINLALKAKATLKQNIITDEESKNPEFVEQVLDKPLGTNDADLLMHTLENNDHKSDSYNIVNYFSNLFKSSSNSDLVSQDTVSSVSDSTFVGDSTSTDSLEA